MPEAAVRGADFASPQPSTTGDYNRQELRYSKFPSNVPLTSLVLSTKFKPYHPML